VEFERDHVSQNRKCQRSSQPPSCTGTLSVAR
jgi:hypothetical protein